MKTIIISTLFCLFSFIHCSLAGSMMSRIMHTNGGFVATQGTRFTLDGKPFPLFGANAYYLSYKDPFAVDRLLNYAQKLNLNVLRVWAFLAEPPADKLVSYQRCINGSMVIDKKGIERLDYVISAARKRGIKLILPLAQNWKEFGGIKAYVECNGGTHHDEFFTNPRIVSQYHKFIQDLITHQNRFTGIRYKDDPTIFAWELANEPRCRSDVLSNSGKCTVETLVNWATKTSQFIKSIDSHHLVSIGDEGFYTGDYSNPYWVYRADSEGVDTEKFIKIPSIDFGTFHMYTDYFNWNDMMNASKNWITRHAETMKRAQKPMILEEYGFDNNNERVKNFVEVSDVARQSGISGLMFWQVVAKISENEVFPGDRFMVNVEENEGRELVDKARKAFIN